MIAQRSISKLSDRLYGEAKDKYGEKTAMRIPETLIELDYCLAWFLAGLARNEALSGLLAFKGGTALRRIHIDDYRFSQDLDFTLTRSIALAELLKKLEPLCEDIFKESGVRFSVSPKEPTKHQRNDTFYLECQGPLSRKQVVKVDVTRQETLVFALQRKPILQTYAEFSDLPKDRTPLVYSIDELAVEKVLAVTDKVRREPRDLYDLWTLGARNLISDPWEIARPLQTKLESREGRAEDDLEELLRNAEAGLRARWGSRLGQQVQELPKFEECFRDVNRQIGVLEKIRRKLSKGRAPSKR